MGTHDELKVRLDCPSCGRVGTVTPVEVIVGASDYNECRLGDEVHWLRGKSPQNGGRPPGGNLTVDAYAECTVCGTAHGVDVEIRNDRYLSATIRESTQ